jgi:hypothetical protein
MKTFNDLVFVDEITYNNSSSSHSHMMFDNGYGVSVVQGPHSYGGKVGLYELAVLDSNGEITYGTYITDDVLGFLTPDDVTRHMIDVQELPIEKIEKQTTKRTNKMRTLKLVRGIAFSTAILAAVGLIGIMIYGLQVGLNDYNLLICLMVFSISALYSIAVDAEISKRNTEIEAMKKVHQTTIKQCVWMMVFLLCMSTLCLFL